MQLLDPLVVSWSLIGLLVLIVAAPTIARAWSRAWYQ